MRKVLAPLLLALAAMAGLLPGQARADFIITSTGPTSLTVSAVPQPLRVTGLFLGWDDAENSLVFRKPDGVTSLVLAIVTRTDFTLDAIVPAFALDTVGSAVLAIAQENFDPIRHEYSIQVNPIIVPPHVPVPEPVSTAILLSGLAGLVAVRRRQRA